MNLELIEWVDSHGCSSAWGTFDETRNRETLRCQSVGWVLHENDELLIVVPHRTLRHEACEPQFCGDMTIPKVAVARRTLLTSTRVKDSPSCQEKIERATDGEAVPMTDEEFRAIRTRTTKPRRGTTTAGE